MKKHNEQFTFTKEDRAYMERALELAARGRGATSPNPMVGALIVKRGRIIAEGWHRQAGAPHAEIEAIRSAQEPLEGATLYVTLEPCCHFGKTPPCTQEIIKHKFERVVVAARDPNPLVSGKGIEELRAAQIRVEVGLCEHEARRQNEFFFTYHEKKRPFIISKWAMTLDGKIATETGHSRWITNEMSRAYAHELRAQVDAVMVGVGTVLMDNPLLTVRLEGYSGRQPLRIIVDGNLRIPSRAKCLTKASPGSVIICTSSASSREKRHELEKAGHRVLVFPGRGLLDFHEVMAEFHKLGIQSILCEGGSSLTGALFEAQLVDKVVAFVAPKIVGGKNAKIPIAGWGVLHMDRALSLSDVSIRSFGSDVCIEGYIAPQEWSKTGTENHGDSSAELTPVTALKDLASNRQNSTGGSDA
ncbi:MAG: bifunctional diaminohydroxyphosphoribosylaminopyrimidine deaminase/5-amino-6-(5-phosphoribosylamino)uracil reductase RibD [Candidatus Sumerlaea chitinivorans]|nr:bifunctional diaminohydroxyphosphoribosylaminopyrimidine deaminase/5-amino-6-(5-phosphoribosylamino)uracil reductase RibD [Candidatus Sumerlaea chitinivorans]